MAYSYVLYITRIYIHIYILPVSNVTKCNTHIFLLSSMVNFAAILNTTEYYHISYSSFESSSHNWKTEKKRTDLWCPIWILIFNQKLSSLSTLYFHIYFLSKGVIIRYEIFISLLHFHIYIYMFLLVCKHGCPFFQAYK